MFLIRNFLIVFSFMSKEDYRTEILRALQARNKACSQFERIFERCKPSISQGCQVSLLIRFVFILRGQIFFLTNFIRKSYFFTDSIRKSYFLPIFVKMS